MKNQKVPTVLGTMVIIIMAITVGVFVWKIEKNQQAIEQLQKVAGNKKPEINHPDNAQDDNKSNQVPLSDSTKTNKYTNKTYGFVFEYPENLVITSNSTDSSIGISYSEGGHWRYSVVTTINSGNLSLEKATKQLLENPQYRNKNITINDTTISGKSAKSFLINDAHDYGNAGVISVVEKNIVVIYGDNSTPENKYNFETFIKSFQFNR